MQFKNLKGTFVRALFSFLAATGRYRRSIGGRANGSRYFSPDCNNSVTSSAEALAHRCAVPAVQLSGKERSRDESETHSFAH